MNYKKQKGFAVGYIFFAIAALAAASIGFARMSGDSSVSTTKLDSTTAAATLASQGGKLKADFTILTQQVAGHAWQHYGNFNGKGHLGETSTGIPTWSAKTSWPVGPKGNSANLTWKTSVGETGYEESIIGYTPADVPSLVCDMYNSTVRGSTVEVLNATLNGVFPEVAFGDAFNVGATVLAAAQDEGDGCFKAVSAGLGRIVVTIR
jgi:hypothetical protein